MVATVEGHRRPDQLCGFGRVVHHFDDDVNGGSAAALTFYENVFCCSNSQQVRSRQDFTATIKIKVQCIVIIKAETTLYSPDEH